MSVVTGPVEASCRADIARARRGDGSPREQLDSMARPYGPRGVAFAFIAYGARIGIEIENVSLLDRVLDVLPPGWRPIDNGSAIRTFQLTAAIDGDAAFRIASDDGAEPQAAESLEQAIRILESDIEITVAEFADPYLFVHAGVVGWHGRAIVLPGRSYAGKSTLVAALIAAGATYYTDEFAVLDDTGAVRPYPRKLRLRPDAPGSIEQIDLSHRAPRGDDANCPLPIGLVALTTYERGAAWQCRLLTPAAAIVALCQHTVAIRRRPAAAFSILGSVVDRAPVMEGTRGEADDGAAWLLAACESATPWPGDAGLARLLQETAD